MLRKIVELVDKDVASNSPPISVIGATIPFVPFMLFVKGAPFDSQPLAATLALCVSSGWLIFVFWRYLRHAREEMAPYIKRLGALRSLLLLMSTILGIVLFVAVETYLSAQIGWPDDYGFRCGGRGCWLVKLAHSLELLRSGDEAGVVLFLMYWALPAVLLGALGYALLKRGRGDNHS